MNKDDASRVMAILASAYPRVQLLPATVQIWYDAALSRCDAELGLRCAMDLVAEPSSKGEFPSPAQFNAIRRLHERRFAPPTPEEQEQNSRLPDDKAQEWFDKMREALGQPPKDRSETT